MKRLLVGTNNRGKLVELQRLLAASDYELVLPADIGLGDLDPEETGTTYRENALLKARAFAEAAHLMAIADDSGLEVDALNGEPGVYSKRWAGENVTEAERNRLILQRLDGIPAEQRTARFVAHIVVVDTDGAIISEATGYCNGRITFAPRGTNGFGYDPILEINDTGGRTMAELNDAEKDLYSHRGNAARQIKLS